MEKILVVDDEQKVTNLYKSLLSQEGYEAIDAPDAHWAVNRLIVQKDIDLVLLDIGLPHVDGVTLNEAAREFNPNIKVIVASARPVEEQQRLIKHADDYYEKSQSLAVLLYKVNEVLRPENDRPVNFNG